MAASPVTPDDAKAIIPDPGSSLCGNFVAALLKLPVFFYQVLNWMLDVDGNLNTAFKKMVADLTLRPGDLIWSGRISDSDGRLLCTGAAVSRTTYADLFAAIGETFGAGDGLTTFNIPDYKDKFPIGAGGTLALADKVGVDGSGNALKITLIESDLPHHKHYIGIVGTGDTIPSSASRMSVATGLDLQYSSVNTTTKAAQTRGDGPDTPVTQTKVAPPLPPGLAAFVYIKT